MQDLPSHAPDRLKVALLEGGSCGERLRRGGGADIKAAGTGESKGCR